MATSSAPTVLVVDDDEMVRDSLKALLETRGFTVADFGSGRDFLEKRDGASAGCLVLDVNMPDMSGLDVLRALRERGDRLPVILITGRRDRATEGLAKALGIVALLDKPIAHPALFAAIEQAIATPAS